MKILYILAAVALLQTTAYCKPSSKAEDEEIYGALGDDDVQNDNADDYTGNYDDDQGEDDPDSDSDEPIVIHTMAQQFFKEVNQTVQLPCNISGKNAVQLWKKNTQILFQDRSRMKASEDMMALSDGSLEIKNLKLNDTGDYTCLVLGGPTTSPEIKHHLEVGQNSPHNVRITSEDDISNGVLVLKTGDALLLTCQADGSPAPKITWHKNTEMLGTVGNNLRIENVRHHNAGMYRCLADNEIGNPDFASIEIKVETKPVVMVDQITVNSDNSYDTELKCTVHAEPRAQVVWKKDNHNIQQEDGHIQLKNEKAEHILTIKGLQETDFGTYTCSATNHLGESKKHVKLSKYPAIVKFRKPEKDSKEVELRWEVQSKAPISEHELQYRRAGASSWETVKPQVENIKDDLYTVKYTLEGLDPGRYETRLKSKNTNGWSEFSETMIFEGVFAKHGHHNKHLKKGRKDNAREKQNNTNEEPIQNRVPAQEVPAEHHESESHVGASETGASSMATDSATTLQICIALLVLLQIRQ